MEVSAPSIRESVVGDRKIDGDRQLAFIEADVERHLGSRCRLLHSGHYWRSDRDVSAVTVSSAERCPV